MKKLLGIVVLGLLVCSNVNADLYSKDKFTFEFCTMKRTGDDIVKIVPKNISWEINLKKKTATWMEILGQQIIEKVAYEIDVPDGTKKESISTIPKCCDLPQYIFNIKTGEVIIINGWTGQKKFMQCSISD